MFAKLVLRGGKVFTADPVRPFVSAVTIEGDRIVAVGDDESVDRRAEVIDLKGGLVTPGFIDAHVHPVFSGLDLLRCHFEGCANAEDAIETVRRYAATHPELDWVIGSGWSQTWFPRGCPPKELLDDIVADRPALIWNTDGHGAWANTRALELSGVTAATPDPPDGRIERLPDGSPQGTLHEGAVALVERHAPEETTDDLVAGLRRGQQELLRYGITGWQDAIVEPKAQDAYLRLARAGELVGRVVGAMWWSRHAGLEQIHELVQRREQSAPGFRPTSVKLMLDGVAENFTASMLESYLDIRGEPTANTGADFIDPEELREIVIRLDDHGFQCHFHAVGDAAVRHALDAIEAARDANGASDNRHHIAHIQVVHPDDIPRFARLGAVANAQPLWAINDEYQTELTKPFLGPERSSWQYPFGDLLRAGARMGMGSDWGVSTANVMEEIDVAVTRSMDGTEPLGPEQAITPIEALTAFTSGSAYINHAEEESGRLAKGMLADLAVFDRDPLADPPLRDARVVMTMVGGRVVFDG